MPASGYCVSQRLTLHYVDWRVGVRQKAGRPVLMLVHGGRDHCRGWDRIARALSDSDRVIAIDPLGHGDSDHTQDGNYNPRADRHSDDDAPKMVVFRDPWNESRTSFQRSVLKVREHRKRGRPPFAGRQG